MVIIAQYLTRPPHPNCPSFVFVSVYQFVFKIISFIIFFQIVPNALYVNKGTNPEIDSYSAFWDNKKLSQTGLVTDLTERGVTDVFVCGLAYDVCVGELTTAAAAM